MAGLEEQDGEDWKKVLEVNLLGAMYGIKHLARHMQDGAPGPSSTPPRGRHFAPGPGERYSASKAALINFTRPAACAIWAGPNVRVNAVCPGLIRNRDDPTGLRVCPVLGQGGQAGSAVNCGATAGRRRPPPPPLSASDEASFVTGQARPWTGNTASLNLPGMKF